MKGRLTTIVEPVGHGRRISEVRREDTFHPATADSLYVWPLGALENVEYGLTEPMRLPANTANHLIVHHLVRDK